MKLDPTISLTLERLRNQHGVPQKCPCCDQPRMLLIEHLSSAQRNVSTIYMHLLRCPANVGALR